MMTDQQFLDIMEIMMTEDLMQNIVIMIYHNEHTHQHLQGHNTLQMKL